jgi:biotin carboxyl carrier protein
MSETFKVSGKRFALPAVSKGWTFERRPGGWLVATSPSGSRRRFAMLERQGKLSFGLGGRLYFGDAIQESRAGAGSSGGSDSDLVAQFPGKVRKLLVAVGSRVVAGDPLILVEAMKMEFTVKAPFDGTISRVRVEEGQQLSPGDRFFDLVAQEKGDG